MTNQAGRIKTVNRKIGTVSERLCSQSERLCIHPRAAVAETLWVHTSKTTSLNTPNTTRSGHSRQFKALVGHPDDPGSFTRFCRCHALEQALKAVRPKAKWQRKLNYPNFVSTVKLFCTIFLLSHPCDLLAPAVLQKNI